MIDLPKYIHQVFAYEIQIDGSLSFTPTWFASFKDRKEALNYIDWVEAEYYGKYQLFFVWTSIS